jgi:hypothetical protein
MDFQYRDIIILICKYLKDKDKLNYLSVTAISHTFKHFVVFRKKIYLDKILDVSYFDRFTDIIITKRFDRLPKNTKLITFDDNFNEPINDLIFPPSVINLKFGKLFNQTIDNCIPLTIKYLTFGRDFNIPIKYMLPGSIIYLAFGRYFNQSIHGILPNNLKHLDFGKHFNQSIDNLPSSVITLYLRWYFSKPIHQLPNRLQILYIDSVCFITIRSFPLSITNLHLTFGRHQISKIPDRVKFLTLGNSIDLSNNAIPSSVSHLALYRAEHDYPDEVIPQSVKYLYVNKTFRHRHFPNHPNMKIKYTKINWY